ncbi:hypothetical protein B0J11DRAFT_131710 [Dendryphion nanum]|uniref:Uncharacterized protein n=1 Tax=Dendryphion nanum TaxID=256645 RepID=A0A9P9D8F0_9PLEO|nr:hypothetical protein B0J11DRAFT_131710 [Dendryphion nanum]
MPPLPGFSDNAFKTRSDVVHAAEALLKPLVQYMSPGKARIRIPHATGTHFDETAAQLEGFARPLWAVGALLMAGTDSSDSNSSAISPLLTNWLDGFENGPDPKHDEYWGSINNYDQRMVEAETVSFALLAVPRHLLWERLSPTAQANLTIWLQGLHGKAMPPANWLWFRVFANLALINVCGADSATARSSLEEDFKVLDSLYMADGWSSDGLWRSAEQDDVEYETLRASGRAGTVASGRHCDYYSGSFAIQFSQLLYVRFAPDLDPERTERYCRQAREFGREFVGYFDRGGACIPFGRSLTYRFACGGFFAALGVAKVSDMPEPLATPGAVKGYLLRHLRWWAAHSENIFSTDGTLNLGWVYPQMYLTENYNSPQSVYWALKSLMVTALSETDDFWQAPETDAPAPYSAHTNPINLLRGPRHITCNHPDGNHHFLLSTAQFSGHPFKATAAKYSKFAYSSAFGFSVPSGATGLAQIAPDNVLALSRDGTETWAVKQRCEEPVFHVASLHDADDRVVEQTPSATVTWWPWGDRSVVVTTTVVAPTTRWPDWHVRIHRIRRENGPGRIFTAEGGFALHGRQTTSTLELPTLDMGQLSNNALLGETEGIYHSKDAVLALSNQGASGIASTMLSPTLGETTVTMLKTDPNTNIMSPRAIVPLVENNISNLEPNGEDILLVTKIFAISSSANGAQRATGMRTGKTLRERWLDVPVIHHHLDDTNPRPNTLSIPY